MKKLFKWLGIIVLSLVIILLIVAFIMINRMDGRLNKTWEVSVEQLKIPKDSASLEKGRQLASMCMACHGDALEGKAFFKDDKIGTIYSPNLTSGKGGVGGSYTTNDWIRSIRHGVNPKGRPLLIMPAQDFQNMSQADLSCLIAYIRSLPPVDKEKGNNILPAFTKILMQAGAFGVVIPAEEIDHKAPFPSAPPQGPTAEYGKYLISFTGCRTCHGQDLNGGKSPDPLSPFVKNLTPAGNLAKWTEQDFIKTMRTGVTPENVHIDNKFMPWMYIGREPDDNLLAMFRYLKTLPKKETPKS